jgi:hypothetical protein
VAENRVTVDGDGKLTLSYTATNEKPKQELYEQLHSMLHKLRMESSTRASFRRSARSTPR